MKNENPRICIEKILSSESYANTFSVRDSDFRILLDTSSIKRIPRTVNQDYLFCHKKEGGGNYKLILTKKIADEVRRLSAIPSDLEKFIHSITHRIINPWVSQEDYKMLFDLSNELCSSPVGIVDMQMMSYIIGRARKDKQTAIISDDSHILKLTSYLRKKSSEKKTFKPNIFAFDIQRPINALFPEIDENYLVA